MFQNLSMRRLKGLVTPGVRIENRVHTSDSNYFSLFQDKDEAIAVEQVLRSLSQYHFRAIFNFDLTTTVKLVREQILIPMTVKLFSEPNALAIMIFFNRINAKQVRFEMLLFCSTLLSECFLDTLIERVNSDDVIV